jgi:hypothetical protein
MTAFILHIGLDVGEEAVDWGREAHPVFYRVLLTSVKYAFLHPGCHSIHCYPAVFSVRNAVLVKNQYV